MKKTIATIAGFAPTLAFAADLPGEGLVDAAAGYGGLFTNFVNGVLVPVLFAAIFVMFAWGIYKTFILGAHDKEKAKEGRTVILNSIIGTVVIISFWGIVNFVANGLNLSNANKVQRTPTVPSVQIKK